MLRRRRRERRRTRDGAIREEPGEDEQGQLDVGGSREGEDGGAAGPFDGNQARTDGQGIVSGAYRQPVIATRQGASEGAPRGEGRGGRTVSSRRP
jgi:hypothetical protein